MEAQVDKRPLTAATTTRVYEAVIRGDVATFRKLLKEDPLIFDQCVIEISSGHFIQFSLLHAATNMGHIEMVKILVEVNRSLCLERDKDGRNPIHIAAIKGHVDVLQVLHMANPLAVQHRTNSDETILHLCVKHYQLEALKILLELSDDDGDELLNSEDTNGNTVLHLAVTSKQPEMVEHLLAQPRIEKNAINKNKMTAVDIHVKQSWKNKEDKKIGQSLKGWKAKAAKDSLNQQARDAWLEEQRTSFMVVASLIATMAFQVGMSPPGGAWQDDKPDNSDGQLAHEAGRSIWSYMTNAAHYNNILVCNTLALISSLSVILLLISGFPCKRHFLSILRIILWITVTATTLTYSYSVDGLSYSETEEFWYLLRYCIFGWLLLIGTLILGNAARLVFKLLGWQRKESIKRVCKNWFTTLFPRNITTTTNDCC